MSGISTAMTLMGEVACALSMGMMEMAFLGTVAVAMVVAVPAFALFLMMMVMMVAMAFGFIAVVAMMSMMGVFAAVSCVALVVAALLRARGFRCALADVCICSLFDVLVRIHIWDSFRVRDINDNVRHL